MNIETLKYFQYIAKYKNITQAAKHLYVSQSTLSRHIMALENELGVKLFERDNKTVTLTEAGRMLYQDSDSFINHMDSLLKNVTTAGKGHSGIIKMTAPNSLFHTLSRIVTQTQAEYPSIRFFVESYEFSEIPLAIKYNMYHIGVTYDYALFEHEILDYVPIDTDEFSIIYSCKFQKEDVKSTLTNILSSVPYVYPTYVSPAFLPQMLASLQEMTGHKIHTMMEVNTSDSLLLNVSLGLGFGLLPNSWFKLLSPDNDMMHIAPPGINTRTDIIAICRKVNRTQLTDTVFQLLAKGIS